MTDEPSMTYEQMAEALREARAELHGVREHAARIRETSDLNFQNGQSWKKQAEELTKQLDVANHQARDAMAEAAELRGYIKRVHETDGESVKHFDVGFGPGLGSTRVEIERALNRRDYP